MSNLVPVVPTLPEEILDPVALNARLITLRQQQIDLKRRGPMIPENATESERHELHKSHEARIISMISEQIDIVAKLRRTSSTSGPAKNGGKRAKKAPLDMSHLLAD